MGTKEDIEEDIKYVCETCNSDALEWLIEKGFAPNTTTLPEPKNTDWEDDY